MIVNIIIIITINIITFTIFKIKLAIPIMILISNIADCCWLAFAGGAGAGSPARREGALDAGRDYFFFFFLSVAGQDDGDDGDQYVDGDCDSENAD